MAAIEPVGLSASLATGAAYCGPDPAARTYDHRHGAQAGAQEAIDISTERRSGTSLRANDEAKRLNSAARLGEFDRILDRELPGRRRRTDIIDCQIGPSIAEHLGNLPGRNARVPHQHYRGAVPAHHSDNHHTAPAPGAPCRAVPHVPEGAPKPSGFARARSIMAEEMSAATMWADGPTASAAASAAISVPAAM